MRLSGSRLFKALVSAALEYDARAPWEDVEDDEPIALRLEGEAEPLFASVMGQAGIEYGLALFRGENALGKLLAAYEEEGDADERFDAMSTLSLMLQPLRDIPSGLRAVLAQAGFECRRE